MGLDSEAPYRGQLNPQFDALAAADEVLLGVQEAAEKMTDAVKMAATANTGSRACEGGDSALTAEPYGGANLVEDERAPEVRGCGSAAARISHTEPIKDDHERQSMDIEAQLSSPVALSLHDRIRRLQARLGIELVQKHGVMPESAAKAP